MFGLRANAYRANARCVTFASTDDLTTRHSDRKQVFTGSRDEHSEQSIFPVARSIAFSIRALRTCFIACAQCDMIDVSNPELVSGTSGAQDVLLLAAQGSRETCVNDEDSYA